MPTKWSRFFAPSGLKRSVDHTSDNLSLGYPSALLTPLYQSPDALQYAPLKGGPFAQGCAFVEKAPWPVLTQGSQTAKLQRFGSAASEIYPVTINNTNALFPMALEWALWVVCVVRNKSAKFVNCFVIFEFGGKCDNTKLWPQNKFLLGSCLSVFSWLSCGNRELICLGLINPKSTSCGTTITGNSRCMKQQVCLLQ